MSFPPATEMFQFAGFASGRLCIQRRMTQYGPGFPIRISADQSLLATPRGFSQRATSFIASRCQGIHQVPLRRLIPASRTAANPTPVRARHPAAATLQPRNLLSSRAVIPSDRCQTAPIPTARDDPGAAIESARASARRIDLVISDPRCSRAPPIPRIGAPPRPRREVFCVPISEPPSPVNVPGQRPASRAPRCPKPEVSSSGGNRPLVEATGLEPVTPCVQSRCSPN